MCEICENFPATEHDNNLLIMAVAAKLLLEAQMQDAEFTVGVQPFENGKGGLMAQINGVPLGGVTYTLSDDGESWTKEPVWIRGHGEPELAGMIVWFFTN